MKLVNPKTFQAFLLLLSFGEMPVAADSNGVVTGLKSIPNNAPGRTMLRKLQDEEEMPSEDPSIEEEKDETESDSDSMEESISARNAVQVPTERECEISQKDKEVEFECKSKTEDEVEGIEVKDEIKFKISADDDGIKVKVEYETETETETMETEQETSFELLFDRIFEFRKGDVTPIDTDVSLSAADGENQTAVEIVQDQAYDWELDTVVQEYLLTDFEDFSEITQEGNLDKFSVTTVDGKVTFHFTIARADTADLTANKMKIDFELNMFPWTASDTNIALVCAVETEQEIEVEYDDDDDDDDEEEEDARRRTATADRTTAKDIKISFEEAAKEVGFVPFGAYTWAKTAEATPPSDGDSGPTRGLQESTTIEVIATSPSNLAYENMLAFSFLGENAQLAERIYWDPEAGIDYESKSGAFSMMASAFLASVASFTAAALLV